MSPEPETITLTIDGREIEATGGQMLVDAAKHGDIEIPVFCYEPKLGAPVGACRMCLVEIEGIPKLQTACSTPVRDGMVVHTQTEQVKEAQNGVVEFLLVNHPLDCPVCDKGGECPLQDISMGWGAGKSRVVEPKRHFQKPVPLSPLVGIDRERCIMCYRCVRFSQEISEDSQLHLLERGAASYVGTFDDRPYVAPFHGNITDLCPVGALTSYTYRFRARPWDIEQAGSVCTLCPSQCNISSTVRDEQVKRIIPRDNPEVDDGWICDKGRYGFEMMYSEDRLTAPFAGGAEVEWDEAVGAAVAALQAGGGSTAALIGDASNEEGYLLQRIIREGLGSADVDSRPAGGPGRAARVALSAPGVSARLADIDGADAVLVLGTDPIHSAPIFDLRVRKAVRRNGTALAVATDRPSALDGGAAEVDRYAPGGAADYLAGLASAVESGSDDGVAGLLAGAEKIVIVWGERIGRGEGGEAAIASLLALAAGLGMDGEEGSGLLEIPDVANGRGLREVGCLPDAGPGLAETAAGRGTDEIKAGLESGEIETVVLFGVDPIRDFPDSEGWRTALTAAGNVIAFSMAMDESTAKADVVFPLESHVEKDATVTHPEGRLQRVRPSARRPGRIRPGWQVLAEISAGIGEETGISSAPEALAVVSEAVPFYAEIDDTEIGGRGVRWQDRPAASGLPGGDSDISRAGGADGSPSVKAQSSPDGDPSALPRSEDPGTDGQTGRAGDEPPGGVGKPGAAELTLGTYRDLWAGPVTEMNPALSFLKPSQRLEVSVADGKRLGLESGDRVSVSVGDERIEAWVALRTAMPEGACFLIEGTEEANANLFANGRAPRVEVDKLVPALEVTRAGGGAGEGPGEAAQEPA